jgi:hypothetical protein
MASLSKRHDTLQVIFFILNSISIIVLLAQVFQLDIDIWHEAISKFFQMINISVAEEKTKMSKHFEQKQTWGCSDNRFYRLTSSDKFIHEFCNK